MKVVSLVSAKGGVGKSCSAIHLATYFSDRKKVLLIDGDQNRSCIDWRDSYQGEGSGLPFTIADEKTAVRLISSHSLVVLDTAGGESERDLKEAAEGSDLLILPTMPDVVSVKPTLRTLLMLQQALPHIPIRLLITIVPPAPSREGQELQTDLQKDGIPVFQTMIRRSTAFGKAAAKGIPIRDMPARDRLGWLDYQALGREIEDLWASSQA